jgi:hypothetical protein
VRIVVIAALLSLVCSAFAQDATSDAEKDGRALAEQMVSKRKGISWLDWANVVKKAYAKRGYSDKSQLDEYEEAFKDAYDHAYEDLGTKVAGPRPEQSVLGGSDEVDEAIKKQLKLTPEDDYEFSHAGPFQLATLKGQPVWKTGYYFKAKGKFQGGDVIVQQGQITYKKSF